MEETGSADSMWSAYCAATGVSPSTPHDTESFGDSREMADALAELVAQGVKRATTSLLADCVETDGTSCLGEAGDLWIVVDGSDRARCIARTTEIRVERFDLVDEQFAHDEGEGDRTLGTWTELHRRFFRQRCSELRIPWSEDVAVVCERFEVVWPRDGHG